jgi:hypothetical protein
MSEYWVSKKRYFCKYCDIYIADDVPSRQQHENGLRHKGNVERFIRGLYKGSEKRKKDIDEEKRDMARVEFESCPLIWFLFLTLLAVGCSSCVCSRCGIGTCENYDSPAGIYIVYFSEAGS